MERKLPKYYQFQIKTTDECVSFLNMDGESFPIFRKLTPSQWKKASKYIDRKLVPFVGYFYKPKTNHKNKLIKVI